MGMKVRSVLICRQRFCAEFGVEFKELAEYFTQPEDDLVDFRHKPSDYRRNVFHPVFWRLREAMDSENWSEMSKHALLCFSDILLSYGTQNMLVFTTETAMNEVTYRARQTTSRSKIPFHIRSCHVRGTLKCEGALTSNSTPPRLLATFSVCATLLLPLQSD